jgi:hypothetical protein
MQLYNRFIAPGPAKANMVAMRSNPTFEWPPTFLTAQQAIVAEMHHAAAVTDAEAALGAVAPTSPRRSSAYVPKALFVGYCAAITGLALELQHALI